MGPGCSTWVEDGFHPPAVESLKGWVASTGTALPTSQQGQKEESQGAKGK
jgi:hypothetical protein